MCSSVASSPASSVLHRGLNIARPPADGSLGLSPRFEGSKPSLGCFEATFGPTSAPLIHSARGNLSSGGTGGDAIHGKLDALEREMARLKCAEPLRLQTPLLEMPQTRATTPRLAGDFESQLDALELELARMKAMSSGPQGSVPLVAPGGGLTAGYTSQFFFAGFAHPGHAPGSGRGCGDDTSNAAVQYQRAENEKREKEELLVAHMDLIDLMQKQSESYGLLMGAHQDLMIAHKMQGALGKAGASAPRSARNARHGAW